MGNYTKTLLIGCGGSGIKTLIRLNELLSSNPNYRDDVRENISYLVVDTDRGDLNKFAAKIRSQMGVSTNNSDSVDYLDNDVEGIEDLPNIGKAHISQGLSSLNQIVHSKFDNCNSENLEKLKEHWLFSPDGKPFRGLHIGNLENGAGQVCQISYLETWNYMQKLEKILSDMANEIRRRNPGDGRSNIQVFLVAGFSGGTGRGSWQLIAFKVRQFFHNQGIPVSINAIFFDSSCYPNVYDKATMDEKRILTVNSYTGMSELSAWLRLMDGTKRYSYSLPSLDNPSTSVIKVTINDDDPTKQSPISLAFLIFGSNGINGDLGHNEQYHNMAATALYSLVVYPEVLGAISSNDRMHIGSFGATTFEVDTYHLHSFFETAIQKKFVQKQCAELTDSDLAAEVDKMIGSMNAPEKDTFLSKNCLWLPESLFSASDGVSLESREEDKNLSILQKIVREKIMDRLPMTKQKNSDGTETNVFTTTVALKKELEKQKNKPVKMLVENLLQLSEIDEDTLAADVNAVLSQFKLDHDNLIPTLNQAVLDQFAPAEGDKPVSLSRCIFFTKKLKACFDNYITLLKQGIGLQGKDENCTELKDVIDVLQGSIDKAFADNGIFENIKGTKFNEKEIASICDQFQYCMYAAIFFKLKPTLIEFYEKAEKHLEVIEKVLTTMVDILKRTDVALVENFESDFGKLSYDEIIKQCFVDAADSDSVLSAIPSAGSLQNVYYRQLKPIMSIEKINEILADDGNANINKKAVMKGIGKQLQTLLDIFDETSDKKAKLSAVNSIDDALKKFPKELCVLIAANVHLKEKIENTTFMEKYFSFEEVLNNNIQCWNKLLREADSRQVARLKDRFYAFLGADRSKDYDEENCLKPEVILDRIVISLVKSSKPWVQLVPNYLPTDSNNLELLNCSILLPLTIEKPADLATAISQQCSFDNMPVRAQIRCPGRTDNELNLPSDRIVVFNAETIYDEDDFAPLDKIQNLAHWNEDTEVNDLLVLAEGPRKEETAWFNYKGDQWNQKQKGIAYVSPIFDNEPLKTLRWHPWQQETQISMDEAQLAAAHKALFYAFLGNGNIPENANVKSILANLGCGQPLIAEAKQDFTFNYPPRKWSEGTMAPSRTNHAWSKDEKIHGINHLVDYLCGLGDYQFKSDAGKKYLESKETGKKMCDALNEEAEAFFTNIFNDLLGKPERRQLVESLYDWLSEQLKTAKKSVNDKEDVPYWEALIEFAVNESKEHGVEIL